MKKIIAGVLAATTMLSLASCGADTTWAFKSGDDTISSGMYVGMSLTAYDAASAVEGFDPTKTPYDQTIEEKDGLQWVIDEAEATAKRYFAVENKFDELELSVTAETKSYLDSMSESYYNQANAQMDYYNKGFGLESYKALQLNQYKSSVIFNEIYGEGGSEEAPVDELKAYFYENFGKVFYIPVDTYTYDEQGNATERPAEEVEAELESYKAKLEASSDFEAVLNEIYGENSMYTVDQLMAVVDFEDTTSTPPVIIDAAKAEVGSVTVVSESGMAMVVKTVATDETDFENTRATVLSKLKMDEYNAKIAEWAEGIEIEKNEKSLSKHSPKNIKEKPLMTSAPEVSADASEEVTE